MKTVKQSTSLLSLLILAILLNLPVRTATAEIVEDKIVIVGIYENAPKVFTSTSGKPSGIFIDIIEHIAKLEGWSLKYKFGTWAEGMNRLEKGEIDLMPDVSLTPDREKLFSFHTIPVLSSWSQIYARKGSRIRSILDLNGKKVLVLEGSMQQDRFNKFAGGFGLNITLASVPDYKTMFAAVVNNEADAAITNRFYGLMHAKIVGLEDTSVIFDPSDLFFAAPMKASKEVFRAIDRHLAEMKNDSQSIYYQSLKHWTSEEVKFKLPFWLKAISIGGIGFLIMSLIGSMVLKHQVDLRTRELKLINEEMEQRIAERTAELTAINKEQRSIFETASTGIVLTKDRYIVHCNRKLEEIFGYDPGELTGQPTRVWYASVEDYNLAGTLVYEHLKSGETFYQTHKLVRKDGTVFWGRVSCRALDAHFPLKGAVVIFEDITAEREAEERLQKALENAQEADRIKSAFLATMSHELRTPLNSIIGFTGILLQGLAGPLNDEQRKQMGMVQNSSRHLLSLINDILDISKIESGQLILECASFDLRASIEKIVKIITPLAEQKNISLSSAIADDVGMIVTDQRRLEQVVLNLLSNAVKFTEKGQVQVRCHGEKGYYIISFLDTGIGMQEEELSIIFKPFHQIDTGIARKHEGTGLGLSISKKIVDMMGGMIRVESRSGQGSTFSVQIPKQTGGWRE